MAAVDLLQRTVLCKYYERGFCERAEACAFAHSQSQLQPKPDLRATQFCKRFRRKGACADGQNCRFAHTWAELRRLPNAAPRGAKGKKCRTPLASYAGQARRGGHNASSTEDHHGDSVGASNAVKVQGHWFVFPDYSVPSTPTNALSRAESNSGSEALTEGSSDMWAWIGTGGKDASASRYGRDGSDDSGDAMKDAPEGAELVASDSGHDRDGSAVPPVRPGISDRDDTTKAAPGSAEVAASVSRYDCDGLVVSVKNTFLRFEPSDSSAEDDEAMTRRRTM